MPGESQWRTLPSDVDVLRRLAERKVEVANDPVNLERRRLWYALDAGRAERPMVLAESWVAFEDLPASRCVCQEEWAQKIEKDLRFEIWQFEEVRDDHVIEPSLSVNWKIDVSDFGAVSKQQYADRVSGNVSSRRWDPPIKDIERDFEKLHPRTFSVDRDHTLARKSHLDAVFDGILQTRVRGGFYWTSGLTGTLIDLVGLQEMMMYMCTDPEGVHRLMAFLQADFLRFIEWLEKERLLSLNNQNDYIGSGSMGCTRALPQQDWREGDPVRTKDLWTLTESQETVGCSPDQFEEFVLGYYRPIVERFGRTYYGCCEPVHDRWHYVKTLANLKRVSISPWCDQQAMGEILGRDYVFSRKPKPTLVSTPEFSEDLIREDLHHTLTAARDCNLEIILKDVHTLCGEPDRIARWVKLAREEIEGCG